MDPRLQDLAGLDLSPFDSNDLANLEDPFKEWQVEMTRHIDGALNTSGDFGLPNRSLSSPSKTIGSMKSVAFSSPLCTTMSDESQRPGSADGCNPPNRIMLLSRIGSPTAHPTGGSHHPLIRIGSRSKVESLMAPPASDAATLRRQVESLQLDLEAHIESEQRLQTINRQLRDRLESYMKQNHENVERAESEFNTLHEDMEQTLELQRRLAQRSASLEKEKKELEQALKRKMQEFEEERASLQCRISKMSDDLVMRMDTQKQVETLQAELEATLAAKCKLDKDLQTSMDEAELLRQNVEDLNTELSNLICKEKKHQALERSHTRCLLRRYLHGLSEAVKEQQQCEAQKDVAVYFSNLSCCRRGLYSLKTAAMRSRLLCLKNRRHAQASLAKCFRAWVQYHLANKKFNEAVLRRQRNCKNKIFSNWWDITEKARMSEGEENHLTDIATEYWNATVKRRSLKNWSQWIHSCAKPLQEKLKSVKCHLETLLCQQALASWKCLLRLRRMKRLRIAQAGVHARSWCQKRVFNRWRQMVICKIHSTSLVIRGIQFSQSKLCHKALKGWLWYLEWRHQRHLAKGVAFRHYLGSLQSKAISSWKCGVKQLQAEARALQEVNRALTRAAMLLWHDHHVMMSKKKQKLKMADVFRERQLRKVARKMIAFWWGQTIWTRASSHYVRAMVSRRRYNMLSSVLHSWMHCTFDSLLISNSKIQSDLHEARSQCEAQKNQTTAVDVENLQLIDKLHAMSSEIAHLKIAISEKEKQEEDLHRSLEDTEVIENSMRVELEQQHCHIEELELESIRLQKKLQHQTAEDSVGEAHHAMIIDGLESTIKDLQSQISEKSSQMESYAKALKDTAERLEGTSDESQEQLSNAFDIAASLRKMLEDRESQFATLEGNCRRRDLELGEIQRKLAMANGAFSETIEVRDSRIRELESKLTQKQNEVRDAQQELHELQIALDAKESLVRRLEYDMKIKAERDPSRTKAYVSSLSSWSSSASQLDVMSGFRNSSHSMQMESMKHVYLQTKAALQQGLSPDHGVSGYRLPAFKDHSAVDTTSNIQSPTPFEEIITRPVRCTSLAPTPNSILKVPEDITVPHDIRGQDMAKRANLRGFLEPVDTLHVEIQQLQARILDRIKHTSEKQS